MSASELEPLLDAALSEGVPEIEEETVDMRTLDGPENRYRRTAFAEALAGTNDKKSLPYKAARRNVERWAKGRTPKLVSIQRIISVQRAQSEKIKAFRRTGAHMRVLVSWYSERRQEWLPPHRWIKIGAGVMRLVTDDWLAGRLPAAAFTLWTTFLENYGVANVEDWLRDVEIISLQLERV